MQEQKKHTCCIEQARRKYTRMAKDLCYDKQCLEEIQKAKTQNELSNIMRNARQRTIDKDIRKEHAKWLVKNS